MGRIQGRDNVYVAAGHFRNGILLAPVTGRLMTQLICEDAQRSTCVPSGPSASANFRPGSGWTAAGPPLPDVFGRRDRRDDRDHVRSRVDYRVNVGFVDAADGADRD
jgi:hypothetical protein